MQCEMLHKNFNPSIFFIINIKRFIKKTHASQLEDDHHDKIKFLHKKSTKKEQKKKQ